MWTVPDQGGTATHLAQDAVTGLAVDGSSVFGIDSTPQTGGRPSHAGCSLHFHADHATNAVQEISMAENSM